MDRPPQDSKRWWLAVAALTAVALLLRLRGAAESPYGDELILWELVHGRSFGSMLAQVVQQEKTPPLGFALSWLFAKVGNADPWMRAPSVIAGTALVPLTAMLARRCFSDFAGIAAAALGAASPFLVFYGSEARSYSLAAALACASLLLLIAACDTAGRSRWHWVGWATTSAAAILCHYTAIPLTVASLLWALAVRPRARRQALAATAAMAMLTVWWLPSFISQADNAGDEARRIAFLAPLSVESVWQVISRALVGSPIWTSVRSIGLGQVPGTVGLILIVTGLAVGTAAAIGARKGGQIAETTWLLCLAAIITPAVLVIASLEPHQSLLLPRNAMVSVAPALALAGGLFGRARSRSIGWLAAALCAAGMMVGSVIELTDYGRPAMTSAARAVNSRWQPGDNVLYANYFSGPPNDIRIHLGAAESASLQLTRNVGARPFLDALRTGSSVFTITPDIGATKGGIAPPEAISRLFIKRWQRTWRGMLDVTAIQWTPSRRASR